MAQRDAIRQAIHGPLKIALKARSFSLAGLNYKTEVMVSVKDEHALVNYFGVQIFGRSTHALL